MIAQHNLEVDKLLRLKPARKELFYPTMPTLNTRRKIRKRNNRWGTTAEATKRKKMCGLRKWMQDNRNQEPDCRQSRIGLSLHQSQNLDISIPWSWGLSYNPSEKSTQKIDRCTTNELVHELTLTFIRPRNITFDRFQLFKAQQQKNESQETFYSRPREMGSHCRFEHLEADITRDLVISNMNNTTIQMDLLSEFKTPPARTRTGESTRNTKSK